MKKQTLCAMVLLLFSFSLVSAVKNPDKPLKGNWDFMPQKEWLVSEVGDDLIANPGDLLASENGNVYFHDYKKAKTFILDKDGKLIGTFEQRGEGPGEVKRHMGMYLVSDKVVVNDTDKLHFFTSDGKFIKSVPNDVFSRRPNVFINEDEFIYAPESLIHLPGKKGEITRYSISSKKSQAIAEFSVFEGGLTQGSHGTLILVVPGLTPMMIIGYDNDKLYFGKNDTYEINVSDLNGKILNTFSVEREQKEISKEAKEAYFKAGKPNMPQEQLAAIIKSFPDKQTYYSSIQVNSGLIYVYTEGFGRNRETQQIDIFSLDGKYLYRAHITFGENFFIMGTELIIKKDHLYVALEDKEGTVMVGKYKITLPKS